MFSRPGTQRGATLVELIIAIVIVSIALAGSLLAMNSLVRSSVDPMVNAQATAIAEAYLEEILLRRHETSHCSNLGPPAGASRKNYTRVADYHGLSGAPADQHDQAIAELAVYRVNVTVACTSLGPAAEAISAARVEVVVTNNGQRRAVLAGYRAEYD